MSKPLNPSVLSRHLTQLGKLGGLARTARQQAARRESMARLNAARAAKKAVVVVGAKT